MGIIHGFFIGGTLRRFTIAALLILVSCGRNEPEKGEVKTSAKSAFDLLNDSIAADPSNPQLLYRRAANFLERGNTRQAHTDITRAIALDSTKAEFHLLFADVSFRGLQIQAAIDAFRKAIELDPRNKDAHLKLAELYLYVKAYPNSISEANEALKLDRHAAKAYFIKGFVYKEQGDTAKALSSFQTAVEVNAEYYDAYIQLGNIFSARKNPVAVQYYNNALRIRPGSTEALYNRGLFLQQANEIEKAIEDYQRILKIDPAYSDAHYNLGYIDMAVKSDYRSAITHFTKAIRFNSEYAEAYYNRGLCHELLGDLENAEKDYRKSLEIIPTYRLPKERLKALK